MRTKKHYTLEFKQEAINLILQQGYSCSEAASRLGVAHSNLSRWVRESSNSNGDKKIASKHIKELTEEQKELEMLRKEVKRLKMEREILKKAAAFFANESD
jgi:transposase